MSDRDISHEPLRAAPSRAWLFASVLFAIAFGVRIAAVLWLRDLNVGPTTPSTNDDYEFNVFAQNLVAGRGYVNDQGVPSSFRAPGFPFVLAGLYWLVGTNYAAAYLALCAVGAASCVLTWLLAREFVEERWARVAGVLSAFYLGHVYFSTVFYSECLFVLLLTLGLWLMVRYLRGGPAWYLASAGLAFGYATLTRPFSLLLLPLFGALLLFSSRSWRFRLRDLAMWTLCFMVVLLPWTARNYRVHDAFVLVATNGGSTFYGGNNPRVVSERQYYGYWLSTRELPGRDLIDQHPNEYDHDKVEWKLGIDWVKDHPGQFVFAAGLKIARAVIGPPDFDAGPTYFKVLRVASYWPLVPLFVLGVLLALRRRSWSLAWMAIHACMMATLATVVIFWGSSRFRDVNVAILMLYAVVALEWIVARRLFSAKVISSE